MRIVANIFLLISVVFLPLSVGVILGIVYALKYPWFVELIFWGALADLLYGVQGAGFFTWPIFTTLGAVLLVPILTILRTRLRGEA